MDASVHNIKRVRCASCNDEAASFAESLCIACELHEDRRERYRSLKLEIASAEEMLSKTMALLVELRVEMHDLEQEFGG
jgi:hypothetical protein